MRRIIIILLLIGLIGGGGAYAAISYWSGNSQPTTFRTVRVERGDLLATVSASGTIEPEEVVDVGAQVAGQILRFGTDPRDLKKEVSYNKRVINYGSPVEENSILAEIDPRLYQTQVDRAKAQLDSTTAQLTSANAQVELAKANVRRSEADLGQMQAKVSQSDRDLARARRLKNAASIADVDYDTAESLDRTNKANLSVGEATILQTKASLKDAIAIVEKTKAMLVDAKAALANAEINLKYCTIRSPVKGVIVDRRVNVGQTVVSSLNAPSLFLIAKDLKRLQVWASVNEADIGNIFSGQKATFTVDTFPGRVFTGVVAADQPRLNASMTQNVVTYTVVVETDNTDGKLLPYLTASVRFEVSKRSKVLLVPNSALRWKPKENMVVADARAAYITAQRKAKGIPGEAPPAAPQRERHDKGVLWVEEDGFVRPVRVTIGPSDGQMTEIVSGEIHEGDDIVLGEIKGGKGGGAAGGNPFAPKLFGGKKQ